MSAQNILNHNYCFSDVEAQLFAVVASSWPYCPFNQNRPIVTIIAIVTIIVIVPVAVFRITLVRPVFGVRVSLLFPYSPFVLLFIYIALLWGFLLGLLL